LLVDDDASAADRGCRVGSIPTYPEIRKRGTHPRTNPGTHLLSTCRPSTDTQMNTLFDNEVNFCNFGRGAGKVKP